MLGRGAPAGIRVSYAPEPPGESWERSLTPWAGLTFEFLDVDGETISETNPTTDFDPTVAYTATYTRDE